MICSHVLFKAAIWTPDELLLIRVSSVVGSRDACQRAVSRWRRRVAMAQPPERPRRPHSALAAAEAVFKPAPPKADFTAKRATAVPTGAELVSIRLDRDVLA